MKETTRSVASEMEKRVAKLLDGRQISNSGATPFRKGDVETVGNVKWLIECKTRMEMAASISIKREYLEKVREEAIGMRKSHYALAFNFGDDEDYFIVDARTFKMLYKLLEEGE